MSKNQHGTVNHVITGKNNLYTFYFQLSTFYSKGSEDKTLQLDKQRDRPVKEVMIFRYRQTHTAS